MPDTLNFYENVCKAGTIIIEIKKTFITPHFSDNKQESQEKKSILQLKHIFFVIRWWCLQIFMNVWMIKEIGL